MRTFKLRDNKEVQVKPAINMSRYDDGLLAVISEGFDRFLSVREYFELEREISKLKIVDAPVDILNLTNSTSVCHWWQQLWRN